MYKGPVSSGEVKEFWEYFISFFWILQLQILRIYTKNWIVWGSFKLWEKLQQP